MVTQRNSPEGYEPKCELLHSAKRTERGLLMLQGPEDLQTDQERMSQRVVLRAGLGHKASGGQSVGVYYRQDGGQQRSSRGGDT